MQNTRYSQTESEYKGQTVYGVLIETPEGVCYRYSYISSFAQEADELIRQMEQDYISPVHFNDIVTDYLVRLYQNKLAANGL